jgi:magnesium-transporting ATPase (P-type)
MVEVLCLYIHYISVRYKVRVLIQCLVTGTLASLTPLCMACFYSVFSIFLTIALNILWFFLVFSSLAKFTSYI